MGVEERIKLHEGFRDHVYLDSLGKLTCGWGHHLYPGSKVPVEVCDIFFKQDLRAAEHDYQTLIGTSLREKLNVCRGHVIVEMVFNMGIQKVLQFRKMWSAIYDGDFDRAAAEMLASTWASQVGQRAITLAELMRKGEDGNANT